MTYRVLVVDDEPSIAEGIKFIIERLLPDCQVVALAFDGLEGFNIAKSLKPDIVLTDIRMPDVDGFEMIRRLREAGISSRFIILSGHAEFAYARTAITLGVEEYITKPVEEDELCLVLNNACASVQEERRKHEQLQQMERTMKEYTLKDILEGPITKSEINRSRLQSLGIPTSYKWYMCTVVENNDKNAREIGNEYVDVIRKQMERYFTFCQVKIVIPISELAAVMIIAHDTDYQKLSISMGKLRMDLSRALGVSISIGMGRMYHKVEDIKESFEEARCALNYKIIKGLDSVITYDQIYDMDSKPKMVAVEDIKKFESCIDSMDDKGCKLVIDDIFRKVENEKDLTLTDLQLLSLNLILSGMRKMSFMQIQLNEYLGKNIFSLESLAKFQTTTQLKNWILNMLKSMNELMLKNTLPEKRDVIAEAKEYMSKNFDKNISLNELSERFFINPYYFSQLFKKKTGETYQNYLIKLRVERAKKLLEETDLKIYEICELVGYMDINHFNKIFERVYGMKPSEYKRNIKG